jgi:hypothetical protein
VTSSFPVISADSHITEPLDCYTAQIDPAWPWSQEMLAEHTAHLTDEMTQAILSRNVSDLYQINTDMLSAV